MNVSSLNLSVDPTRVPLESLATNKSISDEDKVAEVSRQFEAVLVRQMLQDARKPLLAKAEGDPTTNGIYNDMINNQMADTITRGGGLGLAKSLTAQLSHQVLPQPTAPIDNSRTPVKTAAVKKHLLK